MPSKNKQKEKEIPGPTPKDEKINLREITEEMQESYLDYAMSVIVSRALPDVRDGLKPVHRRILYSMHEMGLRPQAKYRKSAQVIGYVLGHYHPHGDAAAYDAMVRMAQDFSMRYPLVDGQGNFGSVDGDSPAAYRYTESKLSKISEEMLGDIEKETVSFSDNYDGSRREPRVLPSKIPNLLMNGSVGIAVGMATTIPPHNLGELIDGLIYLIDNEEADVNDLLNFIKGPDFPTGGTIYNEKDILQAYATGKGPVLMRGKADIIEGPKGFQIIISEIPYQVNKSSLIEQMADLVKDKKIEGIRDLRDESGKEGIRIVIDLKQDSFPRKVLNSLYKYTELQKMFHFNMLALVDEIQPQVLPLKLILEKFIEHRRVVVVKRAQFDLRKAQERAHILEGLHRALDHIDEVIKVIKKSESKEDAFNNLIKRFKFSDKQTQAILDMRLQALAGLEQKKIEDELKEKKELIAHLENLLKSSKKIFQVIKEEFLEIKKNYPSERKTKIIKSPLKEIGDEELIPEQDSLFMITRGGYIKRMDPGILRVQKRGGKGLIGMATKEEDMVDHFFLANTHDNILFFTNSGKVFQTKGYEVPESSRVAKGKAIVNFLNIGQNDVITGVVPIPKVQKEMFLFMTTANGIVKKVSLDSFENVRSNGLITITLKDNDQLKWVSRTSGKDQIIMVSSEGNSVRFKESDVRPMGRTAAGVFGMRLKKDAKIVGMEVISSDVAEKESKLLVVMGNGFGKRTELKNYKIQKRGGRGILTAKITPKTGDIVSAHITNPEDKEIITVSKKGVVIRTSLDSISVLGRATQGVRIMKLEAGDSVASVVIA